MKIIQLCIHVLETLLFVIGICFILLRVGGVHAYVVLSGSMEPNIQTGAVVFVNMKDRKCEVGDIVTYSLDAQLVTHRIVEINQNTCVTKGDANNQADPIPIQQSQILGKVLISIPYVGYLLSYIKSKQGIFMILSILFLTNLFDILSEETIHQKNNDRKGYT